MLELKILLSAPDGANGVEAKAATGKAGRSDFPDPAVSDSRDAAPVCEPGGPEDRATAIAIVESASPVDGAGAGAGRGRDAAAPMATQPGVVLPHLTAQQDSLMPRTGSTESLTAPHLRTVSTSPFATTQDDLFIDFEDEVTQVNPGTDFLPPMSEFAASAPHARNETSFSEISMANDFPASRLRAYPSPPLMMPEGPAFAAPFDVVAPEAVLRQLSGSLRPATPPQSPWTPDTMARVRSGGLDAMYFMPQGVNMADPMFPDERTGAFVPLKLFALPAGRPGSADGLPTSFTAHPRALPLKSASFGNLPFMQVAPGDVETPRAGSSGSLIALAPADSRAGSGSVTVAPILLGLSGNWEGQEQPDSATQELVAFTSFAHAQEAEFEGSDADGEGESVESDEDTPMQNTRRMDNDDEEDSEEEESEEEYPPRRRGAAARRGNKKRPAARASTRNSNNKRNYSESGYASPSSKRTKTNSGLASTTIPAGANAADYISPKVLATSARNLYGVSTLVELTPDQKEACIAHIISKRSRNTEAARRSREKRREHVDELEAHVRDLEASNNGLKRRVAELEKMLGMGGGRK